MTLAEIVQARGDAAGAEALYRRLYETQFRAEAQRSAVVM